MVDLNKTKDLEEVHSTNASRQKGEIMAKRKIGTFEVPNKIIALFSAVGIPTVLVGGSVRDTLLGRESADVDLATPLSIMAMDALLKGAEWVQYRVTTGEAHGTITVGVLLEERCIEVEVTQFRNDIKCDGRHASVRPSISLMDDLLRRDFTINAIAWDGHKFFYAPNAEHDLENRILRTVGNPASRFEEDILRVIRLFRFEARLSGWDIGGFIIEEHTLEVALATNVGRSMKETVYCSMPVPELRKAVLSMERVVMEFTKVFKDPEADVALFLQRMWEVGVIEQMFYKQIHPGLNVNSYKFLELTQNPVYHPEIYVWEHIKLVVASVPFHGDVERLVTSRWIALLHDMWKPETAYFNENKGYHTFYGHDEVGAKKVTALVVRSLKLDKQLAKKASKCIKWHLYVNQVEAMPKHVRKVQADMGDDLYLLHDLFVADHMGRPTTEGSERYFVPVEEPTKPILTGKHLIERGLTPYDKVTGEGMKFKTLLDDAYAYQLETGTTCIDALYASLTVNEGEQS